MGTWSWHLITLTLTLTQTLTMGTWSWHLILRKTLVDFQSQNHSRPG